MTQEEKARAYDEALERARKQRDEYQEEFDKTDKNSKLASILRAAISAVELAFPEFAESEDEKNWKAVKEYIKDDALRSWLEKQKETGIRWLKSDNVKNPDKPYIDKTGMFYTTDGRMCYASEIEKQKEDEGYEAIPVESTLEYKLGFKAGKESEKQKEQKPAEWSEEDDKMLKLLILNIGRYMYFGGMSSERILSFLKSLRPQQRQEWSEEEKEILDSILSHYVLIDKPIDANGIPKEKYISLIKSLRFDTYKNCNSHWKPSEEQMRALNEIVNILAASPFLHQNDYLFNILNGLREELKKLL